MDSNVRKSDEEVSRKRSYTISTERRDGHGTIIPLNVWDIEDFNKIGAFYYQHLTSGHWSEPNPDNALGPSTAYLTKSELIGVGEFEPADFNPLADKIMKKSDFGTLKSASVGFVGSGHWGIESRDEDPEIYYFDKAILKEWSIVHIPSNPDAIKKCFESMDKFMLREVEKHKSKGFKKDYNLTIARKKVDYLIY